MDDLGNLKKETLVSIVREYRTIIDEMQDHAFYVEDEEGALRRWSPPKRAYFDRHAKDLECLRAREKERGL